MKNSKKLLLMQETLRNLTVPQKEGNPTKTVPTRFWSLCGSCPCVMEQQ